MDTLTAKASDVKPIVLRAMNVNRPIFLWGAPGIGKSELVADMAESGELGKCLVIDMRLALMEPTDLRGYPFRNPETNTMEWAPPCDLPTEEQAAQYDTIILFLDELNSAPPSVQAAAYQLILNGKIGQYVLPKNVRIVAAGNRETDRGVTFRMPSPLANRFRHINMEVNFLDWQKWAINNDIHPDVIGYLSFSKGDLFDFDPKSSCK
jgi:MoxR-like ATPase